jgi:hypothetical protein
VKRWLGLVGVAFAVVAVASGGASFARADSGGGCSPQSTKSERWKKEHCTTEQSSGGTTEGRSSSSSNVHVQELEARGTTSIAGGGVDTTHSTQLPLTRELQPGAEADTSGPGEGPGSTDRSGDRDHHGHGGPIASVPSSPVGSGSATLGFDGLRAVDTRFADEGNQFTVEPPDQGLCVGNGYVVEPINSVIGVYQKSNGTLLTSKSLNRFFNYPSQFNRVTLSEGPQPTDPSCVYDQASGKFIVVVVTFFVDPESGAPLGPNRIDLAVSKTGDPTGGWDLYDFWVTDDGTNGTAVHPHCPCLGDYPHIGIDANGLYVTTNEYAWFSDAFNGAQLYAISLKNLTAGAPGTNVLHYDNLTAGGGPAFTVWPANANPSDYVTSADGTEYLLSSMAAPEAGNTTGRDNRIAVWSLRHTNRLDTGGTPDLANDVVETETYALPPTADQKQAPLELLPLLSCLKDTTPLELFGGLSCSRALSGHTTEAGEPIADPYANDEREGPLDALDARMQQVWVNQGLVIGALDTAVQVDGQEKVGIAWFAFDPSGGKAKLASQGYVAVGGNNVLMPAVATLPNGKGVMAMTLSGRDYYPSAAYAPVQVSGGSVTVGSVAIAANGVGPQDGFSEYHAYSPFEDGTPRPRWGDYGAAVSDGTSLWMGSEYIGQSCTYQEYLASGLVCPDFSRAALANWYTRITQVTP